MKSKTICTQINSVTGEPTGHKYVAIQFHNNGEFFERTLGTNNREEMLEFLNDITEEEEDYIVDMNVKLYIDGRKIKASNFWHIYENNLKEEV